MKLWRFVLAMILGRGFRFILEGYLAIRYGEQATEILKHNGGKIGLGIAAAIIVICVVKMLLKRRQPAAELSIENIE